VVDLDVRMVVLGVREVGDTVDEGDGVAKAVEGELTLKLPVDLLPLGQHAVHCDVAVDLDVEIVLRHEAPEPLEPGGRGDRSRDVAAVDGVTDAEADQLARREACDTHVQEPVPYTVA